MDIPVRDTGGSEDTWQNTISRQLKQKPKIDRVDYSKVEIKNDVNDITAPSESSGGDDVIELSTSDFLKNLEAQEESKKAEKPVKEKASSAIENEFDVSDLDLSKDEEPVVEKPKVKKSKEDNIAELRKKAETYENEAKTKEAKLAEYQAKLEEMEATLEKTAFEKSPKFRDKFQAPYEEAINRAVEFAKDMTDDPSIAEKALSLKGKERIEFIDETFGGGAASAAFLQLVDKADSKRGELESALSDYRATSVSLENEEVKSREETMQKINKNFDRMANHLANKLEFFRKGDDDESNALVDKRIAAARNIISGNASENEMLAAPFLAVVAKEAVEKLGKLEAELAKYKARVAEDVSVSPRISRSSSDDNETGSSTRKPKGALEAFKSHLRNL
jgi:hypothetical protein